MTTAGSTIRTAERQPAALVALLVGALSAPLLSQFWGWEIALSAVAGAVVGGLNVAVFSWLVTRLLSGSAPALHGVLIAFKFLGLLAVLAAAVHFRWAAPFPLAMGFLAATFVAPLFFRRADSTGPTPTS